MQLLHSVIQKRKHLLYICKNMYIQIQETIRPPLLHIIALGFLSQNHLEVSPVYKQEVYDD